MGMGLRASALPTARAPMGFPSLLASSPYVTLSPYGTRRSSAHTSKKNGGPESLRGTVNAALLPKKYSFSSAASQLKSGDSRRAVPGGSWGNRRATRASSSHAA